MTADRTIDAIFFIICLPPIYLMSLFYLLVNVMKTDFSPKISEKLNYPLKAYPSSEKESQHLLSK